MSRELQGRVYIHGEPVQVKITISDEDWSTYLKDKIVKGDLGHLSLAASYGYRRTDPETSKAAAKQIQVTKKNQLRKILDAYVEEDDLTDENAAWITGLQNSCYWKRCSELRQAGLIEPIQNEDGSIKTRRGRSGARRMLCRITPAGREALARAIEEE